MSESAPLFHDLGDGRFEPTELCRGPWDPRAMHGGAPSSLLAGELARALGVGPEPGSMHPARLTIDLERPVTLIPLSVEVEIVRPGRKVRIAEARLLDDAGNRIARATLLGIRRSEPLDVSDAVTMPVAPPPMLPSEAVAMETPTLVQHAEGKMFHADAVEHRVVRGTWGAVGPATDWIRLAVEVVGDREVMPAPGGRMGVHRRRNPSRSRRYGHRRIGVVGRTRPSRSVDPDARDRSTHHGLTPGAGPDS